MATLTPEGSPRDEILLKKISETLYNSAVSSARENVAVVDLNLQHIEQVFIVARQESDRAASILIFALIEDVMLEGIRRHVNTNIKGGWPEITGGNGLLATANDRITLIYILYWISKETYENLRLLKSIRNRFAHHANVPDFSDKQISSWLGALTPKEQPVIASLPELSGKDIRLDARALFLMRSALIVSQLVGVLAVGPEARAQRVNPEDVYGKAFDETPENLRGARLFAAKVLLWFLKAYEDP